ncbi:MAG: hypothetical protein OER95_15245, partial [Acidimicrobiia bacterium]|nr:hypothetical protein [Acidimicrobiia bacterium]
AAAANIDPWSIVQVEIKEAVGTKANPKDRARTFTKLLGGAFAEYRPVLLGSPAFLTGARRQELVDAHRATDSEA